MTQLIPAMTPETVPTPCELRTRTLMRFAIGAMPP
jgi:hypothetical protein